MFAVSLGRRNLRGAGVALAGVQPSLHVSAGRSLLPADRAAAASSPAPGDGLGRGGGHHGSGAALRPAGQPRPGLGRLGLLGPAGQSLGADLPPLYPAVDSALGAGRRRRLVLHGVSAAGTPVTASPRRPVIRTGITAFRGSSPATRTWT